MAWYQLETKELQIEISDNEQHGVHKKGYNGISSLTSVHYPQNLFVPTFAGMNLEYFYNGDREYFLQQPFEPRKVPMSISKQNEQTVTLHQSPTPLYGLESWTSFTAKDDCAVDIDFRCIAHKDVFPNDFLALFWASYIHGPENKSIYFCTETEDQLEPKWQQFCTHTHGHESSVLPHGITCSYRNTFDQHLVSSYSPVRFSKPLYFGLFGPMVFALFFEERDCMRFAHSPTGAGADNPAWDFQYIVDQPQVGKNYGWKGRMIYKLYQGRDDVLQEYEKFLAERHC